MDPRLQVGAKAKEKWASKVAASIWAIKQKRVWMAKGATKNVVASIATTIHVGGATKVYILNVFILMCVSLIQRHYFGLSFLSLKFGVWDPCFPLASYSSLHTFNEGLIESTKGSEYVFKKSFVYERLFEAFSRFFFVFWFLACDCLDFDVWGEVQEPVLVFALCSLVWELWLFCLCFDVWENGQKPIYASPLSLM